MRISGSMTWTVVPGLAMSDLAAHHEADLTAENLRNNGWSVLDVTYGKLWYSTVVLAAKGRRWAIFTAHGSRITTGNVGINIHGDIRWDRMDMTSTKRSPAAKWKTSSQER